MTFGQLENLDSSLCIHDARNFDEYTQVLAGDTTSKMAFLGGEEGASLCIALLCTIVLRRRLSSKKRRQHPYQHQFVNVNNNNYTCCAKMAGKEETLTCRKKTVTWTNEMIEDWREIQQTKWHFWEERRVLPFVLHYYVQLYCEGD
jgi:hypothetical protein